MPSRVGSIPFLRRVRRSSQLALQLTECCSAVISLLQLRAHTYYPAAMQSQSAVPLDKLKKDGRRVVPAPCCYWVACSHAPPDSTRLLPFRRASACGAWRAVWGRADAVLSGGLGQCCLRGKVLGRPAWGLSLR